MRSLLLAAALSLALPAPIALAESAGPTVKNPNVPYHDPCDCVRGTIIRGSAPTSIQSGGATNSVSAPEAPPKPENQKADRPLGMG